METLRAENIAKRYGNKQALDGVTVSAEGGMITAILGPNGAGKTTLIRIMMTLIHPDRGRVSLLGMDPFREKDVFKRVGYVQELPNLPPFLTGRELLELSAKLKGVDRNDVRRALELVGMTENADKKIAKYSKGMIQRIALAEALLGNPELLVMDEPNVGTDPILNLRMRDVLNELTRSGVTVLMTSHELEEVKKLAHKVIFIYRGKIFFSGTTEELVLRFLGVRVILETPDREQFLALMKGLDYVKSVEERRDKYVVELSRDAREELLRELVLGGVRIRSFYLDQDLEQAYERAIKEAEAR
ncbi:putative branched-chain amino acid transport ATP-binding protein LivG [Metallosphaera sp. J1]|uniref:ABC transporter ATP-binding protein n=1 Tax=Metallosphaera javensis (ex Hofmann et al. 2022) TaxID=99938 RepID=UPI001EDD6B1D|nr:ABC transporter ATP-binding protein [Metallosphaera javensis (ex Hofmann et al. 2022)]MCG3109775.1 putative branched-chain amino acid transport ATP-binding protein LivG [Metallosphaera javensis (ex Hofmann et al. 2022)]